MIFNPAAHGRSAWKNSGSGTSRSPTSLVDTSSIPTLMRLLTGGQIEVKRFVTHHFDLDEFDEAYDVLARGAVTGALKVFLSR
jgi:alcohol dehydrogenase